MSDHAITCQHPVPAYFAMPCVRCLLDSRHSQAIVLISAASGHGLAACGAHREATATVVPRIEVDDDNAVRVLFGLPELPVEVGADCA
ncbi:hypothetical protein FSY75_09395 [Streptomyces sp. TR1341]|uniref:hypothetical protein n=1 Tax=Streptomyces sp. TR1341 TaxID=2601266 RepID=UPI00138AE959|nr:hypothetical protein [Streptomyces sp. TR1341]